MSYEFDNWDADWATAVHTDADGNTLGILDRGDPTAEIVLEDEHGKVYRSVIIDEDEQARDVIDALQSCLEGT